MEIFSIVLVFLSLPIIAGAWLSISHRRSIKDAKIDDNKEIVLSSLLKGIDRSGSSLIITNKAGDIYYLTEKAINCLGLFNYSDRKKINFFDEFCGDNAALFKVRLSILNEEDAAWVFNIKKVDNDNVANKLIDCSVFISSPSRELAEDACVFISLSEKRACHVSKSEVSDQWFDRAFFDKIPYPIILIDKMGYLRYANSQFLLFLGYQPDENILANNFSDFIHSSCEYYKYKDKFMSALLSKEKVSDIVYVRKDGAKRFAETSITELTNDSNIFMVSVFDISERESILSSLNNYEKQLSLISSRLNLVRYKYKNIKIENGKIHHDYLPEYIDSSIEKITGKNKASILNPHDKHRLGDLIDKKERHALVERFIKAVEADAEYEFCYPVHHVLYGSRWVMDKGVVFKATSGNYMFEGFLVDVTAEVEALEYDKSNQKLLSDTNTGYICLNSSGRVLDSNNAFSKIFELPSSDKIIGHSLLSFFDKKHEEYILDILYGISHGKKMLDIHLTYKLPSSKIISLVINAITVKEHGQSVHKCLIVDATQVKTSEDLQKQSESRYKVIFENAGYGICFLSLDEKIIELNHEMAGMLGVDLDDFKCIELGLSEIAVSDSKCADDYAREQAFVRGWSDEYKMSIRRLDGIQVVVTIQRWIMRDELHRVTGTMCIVKNATQIENITTLDVNRNAA